MPVPPWLYVAIRSHDVFTSDNEEILMSLAHTLAGYDAHLHNDG